MYIDVYRIMHEFNAKIQLNIAKFYYFKDIYCIFLEKLNILIIILYS